MNTRYHMLGCQKKNETISLRISPMWEKKLIQAAPPLDCAVSAVEQKGWETIKNSHERLFLERLRDIS